MKNIVKPFKIRQKRVLAFLLAITVLMLQCVNTQTGADETVTEKFIIPIRNLNIRSAPNAEDDDNIILESTGGAGGTFGMLLRYVSETEDWYTIRLPEGTEAYASKARGYTRIQEITYTRTEYEAYCQELEKEGFPEGYRQKLFYLHKLYPQWVFRAQKTGLKWSDVIKAESRLGSNLTYYFFPTSWKSTQSGAYNWETDAYVSLDSGGWHQASSEAIAFCMDPRNWLGTATIFEFFSQSYDSATQTKEILQELVEGTFLEQTVEDTDGQSLSYVDTIYEAGAEFGVSPYVLSAMILMEQGNAGKGGCIAGTHSKYPGYFNFFNIGAYQSGGMDAVERGLWYAKGGNDGATTWQRPWNTRAAAIRGGAEWYADGYINEGQDTLYLKKFNVQGNSPYSHQYMTNVTGAISESITLSSGYDDKMRDLPLIFKIPVYEEMPEASKVPIGTGSPNNMLKEILVNGEALKNINSGSIGDIVVPYDTEYVEVSAKGYSSAASVTGTGRIQLQEGRNSITLVVTAGNGDKREYSFTVAKEAAPPGPTAELPYSVKDEKWMFVPDGVLVKDFKAKWKQNEWKDVMVSTEEGTVTEDNTTVGSGLIISAVESATGRKVRYTAIVLGDVNGDGKVTNTDRIRIRNYILGTSGFSESAFMAADVNNDGKVTNTDRIRVRNYILGTGQLG